MPFGFHFAVDTLPSKELQGIGSRSTLAVSGFRFRARVGFSIPASFLWPARNYPRVRIQRSSFERRRDFNPHEQYAAQHTLWASPTPGLGRSRLFIPAGGRGALPRRSPPGSPRFLGSSVPARCPLSPRDVR